MENSDLQSEVVGDAGMRMMIRVYMVFGRFYIVKD
jgi:hypothetical protein